MRTTIRLDDGLFAELKRVAAATSRTMTAVIDDALREALARREVADGRMRVELPTYRGGGGLQPGVDLDDSAALLDLMEQSR